MRGVFDPHAHGGISRGDGGVHIYTGAVTKPSKLDDFACTRCGTIESYVPDPDKLQAIKSPGPRSAETPVVNLRRAVSPVCLIAVGSGRLALRLSVVEASSR